jgi:hypothetical protein
LEAFGGVGGQTVLTLIMESRDHQKRGVSEKPQE